SLTDSAPGRFPRTDRSTTPNVAPSVTKARTQAVAREWIEAFNAHDLERILSHYAESVELNSLLGTKLLDDPAGTGPGEPAPRPYFARGLAGRPRSKVRAARSSPASSRWPVTCAAACKGSSSR